MSISCSVSKGDLPLYITWKFNGRSLTNDNGLTVNLVNKRLSALSIDSVQADHIGNYSCIARNAAGSATYSAFLNVNGKKKKIVCFGMLWLLLEGLLKYTVFTVLPQILPLDFGEESVNAGDLASLTCSVHKGDLPIDIEWLHNNKSITDADGISVSRVNKKISTLSIDSVLAEHAGEYTCLAKNPAGSTSSSAFLNVNGIKQYLRFLIELKLLSP